MSDDFFDKMIEKGSIAKNVNKNPNEEKKSENDEFYEPTNVETGKPLKIKNSPTKGKSDGSDITEFLKQQQEKSSTTKEQKSKTQKEYKNAPQPDQPNIIQFKNSNKASQNVIFKDIEPPRKDLIPEKKSEDPFAPKFTNTKKKLLRKKLKKMNQKMN